jgi:hypothetical protein
LHLRIARLEHVGVRSFAICADGIVDDEGVVELGSEKLLKGEKREFG